MRVIITGATGFIGGHLARCLHRDGVDVVATGRSEAHGRALQSAGIEFRPADMLDCEALMNALAPAGCVVHCAGKSADWGGASEFHNVNVVGTRNLVRACEHHGIRRIVFLSTPSIYYTGRDRFDVTESEPVPPRQLTHYAGAKLQAEQELLGLAERGFEVIILRPRAVLGPHDTTITPRILRLAEGRSFPLIGGGEAITEITAVDNLVDAVRAALNASPAAWNTVYNITNGEPIRIRDWFARVLDAFDRPFRPRKVPLVAAKSAAVVMELASRLPFGPKEPAFTRFSVGYMATSMTLSLDRARSRLGYSPKIDNEGTFERLAQWHRSGAGGR